MSGPSGDRTHDLRVISTTLYRLSYTTLLSFQGGQMRHKQLHFNFSCLEHSEVYQQFVLVLLRVVNATSKRDVKHARRELISVVIYINVDG